MGTTNGGSDDHVAEAIRALTAVAKSQRDFAEIACHIITAVAANVGGVDALLAARPDSWEADLVRQMVDGTAGHEPDELGRWRTAPIRLELDVDGLFSDLGIDILYEAELDTLEQVEAAAVASLIQTFGTEGERARIEELNALMPPFTQPDVDFDQVRTLAMEVQEITRRIEARGREAQHPQYAALEDARRWRLGIEALWVRDIDQYAQSYAETVQQLATGRGLSMPVEVDHGRGSAAADDAWADDDALSRELSETARLTTPLPMTGTAPDWTPGATVDQLRLTQRTYLDRVRAL